MPVIDLGFKPRPWQDACFRQFKRFNVLVCHRRGGKTVLAIIWLVHCALSSKRGDWRGAYIAPEKGQAKSVAWDYLKGYALKVPGTKVSEVELYVEFSNGARIRLAGADDPDRLRGVYLDASVLDELAQMPPSVWGEVIRPALTDRRGSVLFIGTPKGLNLLSELFFAAPGKPDWFAARYTCEETGAVPEDEIASARRDMSAAEFRQEFMCDFTAGDAEVLIQADIIDAAMKRPIPEAPNTMYPLVMGVDVARFGDDDQVLFFRRGRIARQEPIIFHGLDLMELGARVVEYATRYKVHTTFIDQTGMGGGVVDRCRQLGLRVIGVDNASTADAPAGGVAVANKSAEQWVNARQWLKDGGCLVNNSTLRMELGARRYGHNLHGEIVLESKKAMKARGLSSPNCFIAGTMVAVPGGQRPIETLREGDAVLTPVGISRVIKAHRNTTARLTTARFSNGAALTGTCNHKIFTWGGPVRIDALALANEIETMRPWSRILWHTRRLLSTRESGISFKIQADTTKAATRLRRKDFFTGGYGSRPMVLYRTAIASITSTVTGLIAGLKTWSAGRSQSTRVSTSTSAGRTKNKGQGFSSALTAPGLPLQNGTAAMPALHGIANTASAHGTDEHNTTTHAAYVVLDSKHGSSGQGFAPRSAEPVATSRNIRPRLRSALSAALRSCATNIGFKSVVPVDVATADVEETSVYNLTLDTENVYYANGILVFNCADAFCLTLAYPVAMENDELGMMAQRYTIGNQQTEHDPFRADA